MDGAFARVTQWRIRSAGVRVAGSFLMNRSTKASAIDGTVVSFNLFLHYIYPSASSDAVEGCSYTGAELRTRTAPTGTED